APTTGKSGLAIPKATRSCWRVRMVRPTAIGGPDEPLLGLVSAPHPLAIRGISSAWVPVPSLFEAAAGASRASKAGLLHQWLQLVRFSSRFAAFAPCTALERDAWHRGCVADVTPW